MKLTIKKERILSLSAQPFESTTFSGRSIRGGHSRVESRLKVALSNGWADKENLLSLLTGEGSERGGRERETGS